MRRDLKRSIIILVHLMAFQTLINAEDEDDIALAKIDKLLLRYPRTVSIENHSHKSSDFTKRELESKLSRLLEFHRRDSPFVRFDPEDKANEEDNAGESADIESDDVEDETTTESPKKHKSKHVKLAEKIRQKLTDKNTKVSVSLPVAIIIMASTILVTCCCALYVRNRLAACFNKLRGTKKRKSKMLFIDAKRGRSLPRTRKKSVSSSKKRARSLSQDVTNVTNHQTSAMTMINEQDEPSTTGCYRCCEKKKKRGYRNK